MGRLKTAGRGLSERRKGREMKKPAEERSDREEGKDETRLTAADSLKSRSAHRGMGRETN